MLMNKRSHLRHFLPQNLENLKKSKIKRTFTTDPAGNDNLVII